MGMASQGEVLLDALSVEMRQTLPPDITQSMFDDWVIRYRRTLIGHLDLFLERRAALKAKSGNLNSIPEHWTASRRTKANIAAMRTAAKGQRSLLSPADRAIVAQYSGWGGLSIEKVRDQFPPGFPAPHSQGLIHEYYTPTKVVREVARVITPLLPGLERNGRIIGLEPSAGIGRFLHATNTPAFARVQWNVVEYSELAAHMLDALRVDIGVFKGSFESWVAKNGAKFYGEVDLILANPPYGIRGASKTVDKDRSYRETYAYAYFLRRGLDLLAPGGLGVYVVPAGFLSGTGARVTKLRETILKRHHLSAAYRLPSKLFPGANLVTDLLFFRARSGELAAVDPGDAFILKGRYFKANPQHILGTEVGRDGGEEDQTKLPRWGYEVKGTFESLPDLIERPMCSDCETTERKRPKFKKVRRPSGPKEQPEDYPELEAIGSLGLRISTYLSLTAEADSAEPQALHGELQAALESWVKANGNPHVHLGLRRMVKAGDSGAARFLSVFDRKGQLIPALKLPPTISARYLGKTEDVIAQATHLFRTYRSLTVTKLYGLRKRLKARTRSKKELLALLFRAGWALDEGRLYPEDVYLTGNLWPKYDRAKVLAEQGDVQARAQVKALLKAIGPVVYEDIGGVDPQAGWVPIEVLECWMSEELSREDETVELERVDGLLQVKDVDYRKIKTGANYKVTECIGWINHDRTLFKPSKQYREDSVDEARLRVAEEYRRSFRAYIATRPGLKETIEVAYNRKIRGYVAPTFSPEPFQIARWTKTGHQPHPHQYEGARRIIHNRGGLLAFDVGVGKTYTGCAVLAKAREEGWAKRPVILAPNSIIWKWYADIQRVLPDYRVGVVGSRQKVITRGPRKGFVTSETDTPEQRAATWARFQGGEFDVVLLTYTAMPRTQLDPEWVQEYAESVDAIKREVALRKRNAEAKREPTERQQAIIDEGLAAWVAETVELPSGWEPDPGIGWSELQVDLLIVDEAQNFKNLYLPEPREGGVPRFMGNAGAGSKRAWHLDFRAASVRERTGGSGVVLLSATPAKNSPLEFYNLIQYVDGQAWNRMGIRDSEQFIDRYLNIEMKQVIDSKMEMVERSAVVGFTNLHELRDVIFRYGEFKTAEDVGLKLPQTQVEIVEVDMDYTQEAKYEEYVAAIEEAMSSSDPGAKAGILGYLARMALVSIHGSLDEKYTWKTAGQASPNSPKFTALAERIAPSQECGHIVFVDNLAAHRWIKEVLVRAGVPPERIAVLNGKTAKAAADRQRIAQHFNGDAEAGVLPKYDVVIANAIAYEGIDLQTRTCAIHHLDLPWEPATLQQRNGRGVRQGNILTNIAIYYYFSRRSQDGLRFNLIQGKHGWMTELLKSQKRDTNNPAAQMDLGPEEILLLISRDPEKTQKRLDELRVKREAAARKKILASVERMINSANARFRRAERAETPEEVNHLRHEAEAILKELAMVDPEIWPWARHLDVLRHERVVATEDGAFVWSGLKVGPGDPSLHGQLDFTEFGRVNGYSIAARSAYSAAWRVIGYDELSKMKISPQSVNPTWPDEEEALGEKADELIYYRVQRSADFASMNWALASDPFIDRIWPAREHKIRAALQQVRLYEQQKIHVPVVENDKLAVKRGDQIGDADLFRPTERDHQRYMAMAPKSGLTWRVLNTASHFWWGRGIPSNLLAVAKRKAEQKRNNAE